MLVLRCVLIVLLLVQPALANSENKRTEEFRGIWVITWEIFRPSKDAAEWFTGDQLKQRIIRILDNVKKARLNAVIWQVRQGGTSYYPSRFEPWGKYLNYQNPGFDPLHFAITEAHKRGLEFHAWFNTFEARDLRPDTPAARHPEWVATDGKGRPMPKDFALSPGLPEVRFYLHQVAMEIVSNYEVDGLHLDYVRWSELGEKEDVFDPIYRFDAKHPESAGVPAGFVHFEDWRREAVTRFVRELKEKIMNVKPQVKLSMAAIGKYDWGLWNGYHAVYQDSALWFNRGYIDQLMGMHYRWHTGEEMLGILQNNCPECWYPAVKPGVLAGRKFSVGIGSYLLRASGRWQNHEDILSAIRTHAPWVAGVQFFSYGDWALENYFSTAAETLFPL